MAVRIGVGARSAVAVTQQSRISVRDFYIKYRLNGQTFEAQKLDPAEFSAAHRQILSTARLTDNRRLLFDNPAWRSLWLGAGEEKSVYLVVDEVNRAFAVELLVQGGYLNGHLTEGYYLTEMHLSNIAGLRRDDKACISLKYSGEARIREYIYGETLAGPANQAMQPKGTWLARQINCLSLSWAAMVVASRYASLRHIYKDAHEANVVIELIPLHNPERKSHYLLPIPALAHDGHLHWYFYRLTPIDVRSLGR